MTAKEQTAQAETARPPAQSAAPVGGPATWDRESLERALAGGRDAARPAGRWWRDARRRRLLALADCFAATAAVAIAVAPERAIWLVVFLPVWVLIAKLVGLYDRDHRVLRHLTVDEAPGIIAWGAIGAIAVALLGGLTPAGTLETSELIVVAVAAIVLAFVLRVGARASWRLTTPRERVLVVGKGALSGSMRRKLTLFRDLHMVAVDPGKGTEAVDRVILAHERLDAVQVARIAETCRRYETKLNIISPLRGQATPQGISRLAELPVLEYGTSDVSRSTMLLKRLLDLLVAVPMILLALPLLPLIAIAIAIDSRGSVMFVQRRAGRGGEPFRLYKFRTMHAGAEHALSDLISVDELPDPMFKLRSDPRVTRVGRVLRRLSLDEIPQLWNLVRGDMSLVGPRPEQLDLVDRYSPEHRFRLGVKPGLTGPMQVHGRGELLFAERLAIELDYVENLSIGRDLRILALTPISVMRGTGAF